MEYLHIYLHLAEIYGINVGKYAIHSAHMGWIENIETCTSHNGIPWESSRVLPQTTASPAWENPHTMVPRLFNGLRDRFLRCVKI